MKDSSVSLPNLPSRSTLIGIVVGFFLLTFIIYFVSLGNRFVAWDDNYVIDFNPVIHGLTIPNITKAFTTFVDPELYDPLTFISYQIDYTLDGLKPFIFHLDNLIQHTLNAILVVWLIFLLSKKKWIALVCGILFAVHPLNVEAVAWASARKDTLSTLFFLLTLISYLYYRSNTKKWIYALGLFFFLCGLLSKVMVLTVPFVLLLIDYLEHRVINRRMLLEKIPYFLLPLPFGIVALFGKTRAVTSASPIDVLLAFIKGTMFYLEKLCVPIHLSVLYPYSQTVSILSPDFFLPVIGLIILLFIAWFFRNRFREITFGILFYLITLVPTVFNVFKGGTLYFASDRYVYISEIGIFFMVATVIFSLCTQVSSAQQSLIRLRTASGIIGCLAIVFATLAYKQSLVWQNTQTLFVQTLKYYPNAVAARINLGFVYSASGLLDQAMQQFNAGLQTNPTNALLVTNIAGVYDKQGKTEDAIAEYKKAIAMDPKQPDAVYGLGSVYEKQGKLDDAFALYTKTQELDPTYVGVYNGLGSIDVQKGNLDAAEAMYQKALTVDPYYPDALYNLGYLEEKKGNLDTAADFYTRTLAAEGDKVNTLSALAGIYAQQNKAADTARILKRILAIDPTNAFATKLLTALQQSGLAPK
jgi:tetratricopeptide (TPR) repeat protein